MARQIPSTVSSKNLFPGLLALAFAALFSMEPVAHAQIPVPSVSGVWTGTVTYEYFDAGNSYPATFTFSPISNDYVSLVATWNDGIIVLTGTQAGNTLTFLEAGGILIWKFTVSGGSMTGTQAYADGTVAGSFTLTDVPYKTNGAQSPNTGQCFCGEPISVGTGNLFEQVTDYATAGPNQLDFTRSYNSNSQGGSTFAVSLGTGWRSTYDRYLRLLSSPSVMAERANGQQLNFNLSSGVWTSDSDVDLKLTQSGSTWTLTDGNDTVETYNAGTSTKKLY